jgi:hypothetical protein
VKRNLETVVAVVGSFALAVGLVVQVSGVMRGVEEGLLSSYLAAGFSVDAAATQPWWSLLVAAVLVYGLALLLLEVPGLGRRILLASSVLVLLAAASPVLALWGVFWSPLVAMVSGAWSAFCASLWARHHSMPCEATIAPGEGNVISMTEKQANRKQG